MPTIEEEIKALMPAMTEQVAAQIRQRALANLEYTVANAVTDEVKKYVADVIVPSVQAELEANEAVLKASVLSAVQAIAQKVGEKLVEQMVEKLSSYQGEKMIKEMFGPLLRGY